jgi:hypothetical protein
MRELDDNNRVNLQSLEVGSSGDAVTLIMHTNTGTMHVSMPVDKAKHLVRILESSIQNAIDFEE